MTLLFCTKRHENAHNNRFCSQCGEKLTPKSTLIVSERYHILRELGQGGFGRTYLAEDSNRFKELCVLKEFAPQIQNPQAIKKAEELFQREAGVLYQLQHPQIPKFRELCLAQKDNKETLFLVQDYIPGETYRQLLNHQQTFSETEIINFLQQILPVLQHIHALGVIHRDISPENIIKRSSDNLPVLIDFGGVKTAAISAISQANQTHKPVTHIGKPGYAPEEQLQQGKAYPSSDLYSLAVTAIVLLTGKEPKELFDNYNAKWHWRKHTNISPQIAAILDTMISRHPGDRYQTAREIIQALPNTKPSTQTNNNTQIKTLVVAPAAQPTPAKPIPITPQPPAKLHNFNPLPIIIAPLQWILGFVIKKAALGAGLLFLAGITTWAFPKIITWTPPTLPKTLPIGTQQPQTTQARLNALNISEAKFYEIVDKQFYQLHPELNKRPLTTKPKDEKLRQEWNELAETLLKKLEQQNLANKSIE